MLWWLCCRAYTHKQASKQVGKGKRYLFRFASFSFSLCLYICIYCTISCVCTLYVLYTCSVTLTTATLRYFTCAHSHTYDILVVSLSLCLSLAADTTGVRRRDTVYTKHSRRSFGCSYLVILKMTLWAKTSWQHYYNFNLQGGALAASQTLASSRLFRYYTFQLLLFLTTFLKVFRYFCFCFLFFVFFCLTVTKDFEN